MRFKVSISKKAALITAAAVAGIVVASAVGFIIVCKRKASKEIKERLDNNEIDESILEEEAKTIEEAINQVIKACPLTVDFIINSVKKIKNCVHFINKCVQSLLFAIFTCNFLERHTSLRGIRLNIYTLIVLELIALINSIITYTKLSINDFLYNII